MGRKGRPKGERPPVFTAVLVNKAQCLVTELEGLVSGLATDTRKKAEKELKHIRDDIRSAKTESAVERSFAVKQLIATSASDPIQTKADELFQICNWLHIDKNLGEGRVWLTPFAQNVELPLLGTVVTFNGHSTVEISRRGPTEWNANVKFTDYQISGILPGRPADSTPLVGTLKAASRVYSGTLSLNTFQIELSNVELDLDISQPSDVVGAHLVKIGTIVDTTRFDAPFEICFTPTVVCPIDITPPIFPKQVQDFISGVITDNAPAPLLSCSKSKEMCTVKCVVECANTFVEYSGTMADLIVKKDDRNPKIDGEGSSMAEAILRRNALPKCAAETARKGDISIADEIKNGLKKMIKQRASGVTIPIRFHIVTFKEPCEITVTVCSWMLVLVPGSDAAKHLSSNLYTQLSPKELQSLTETHEKGHVALGMLTSEFECNLMGTLKPEKSGTVLTDVLKEAQNTELMLQGKEKEFNRSLENSVPATPGNVTSNDIGKQLNKTIEVTKGFVDAAGTQKWIDPKKAGDFKKRLDHIDQFIQSCPTFTVPFR